MLKKYNLMRKYKNLTMNLERMICSTAKIGTWTRRKTEKMSYGYETPKHR